MSILVTGGAGYIGSHTCVELQQAGYDVVVLDNLSNASEKSLERVKALTGKEVTFYRGDILDRDILNEIMEKEKIDCCIHFAGLKAVGESVVSVLKPLQEEVERLSKDKAYIDGIIKENAEKANYYAMKTLRKVQKKVGFPERIR